MQDEPKKTLGNYNEFHGANPPLRESQANEQLTIEQQRIVRAAIGLVTLKINKLLGDNNHLTSGELVHPTVIFVESDPEHPDWAGYYSSFYDRIGIITGNIEDKPLAKTKVVVHEYLHRFSHNGRDDNEHVSQGAPIAVNNNVGFRRHSGLDIRKGQEGQNTTDYFLSWNEAVTEQLAIDILPDVHETYDDYRGLLNQVIDDAVTLGLGSKNKADEFEPWTRDQFKDYIYKSFFRGDLAGFTKLLQTIYMQFEISEQQFGLMTHRDDLPSVIESNWRRDHPNDPPPSPSHIVAIIQRRLDAKTSEDYITDVVGPEPGSDGSSQVNYGTEYDTYVRESEIVHSHKEVIDGKEYSIDSHGYIIYQDEEAESILNDIRTQLDELLDRLSRGEVDATFVAEQVDELLFNTYFMSMLSDGFRDFYIYKHRKLDNI